MFSKLFRAIISILLIVFGILLISGFSPRQIKEVAYSKFTSVFGNLELKLNELKTVAPVEVQKEVEVPATSEDKEKQQSEPIKPVVPSKVQNGLDSRKVLEITNTERKNNSVAGLTWNTLLAKAAEEKAKDMFTKQYFAHVSPEGHAPEYFVSGAGYQYITTGENLALGVFKTEEALVKAWMDSPGHRENILNKQFKELGVAVVKGVYQGDNVVIGVQEFGTSVLVCNKPDENEKTALSSAYKEIESLGNQINSVKESIELMDKQNSNFKAVVESYNKLVQVYNAKIASLKSKTTDYNSRISAYNKCVDSL